MKKFTAFFVALAIFISMIGFLPALADASGDKLLSGYYGIDRKNALMGQVVPGTSAKTLLTRVLGKGDVKLSGGVATGTKVTLSRSGSTLDSLSLVVLSDCSGDGQFSVTDMLMVKSMLLSQRSFNKAQAQAADVSGDNSVTITDFLQMKSKLLGLLDFSPRLLPGAESCNSVILTVGDTYAFGPADGVLLPEEPVSKARGGALELPDVPFGTTAATEPTTKPPTEPATEPTTEPTTAPTTEPTTQPQEKIYIDGDAITWDGGQITARKLGTARITWDEESLIVTVCEQALKITVPGGTLHVGPGSKYQLQPATNHPVDPKSLSYSSSDTKIVTVNASGQVSGVKEGTATVTVSHPSGAKATQKVRVITLVTSLSLSATSLKMKPGTTKTLTAAKAPSSSPETLVWSSSDPAIASVDQKGVITGHKLGTVTVTCKTQYGGIVKTCKVKVCNLIQVALTFDDGPSSSYTLKMLDLLKKYDVDATFFLVGRRIKSSPASVKRMAQEGHEIGYHTWSHTYFYQMTKSQIQKDLADFQKAVHDASGAYATVYRAPGGSVTKNALAAINMPHIHWSVDTRDWESRNPTAIKNAIVNGLKDGAIILLHDIHGTTYTGTKQALEYIFSKDLDVEFMTVTELLSRKGQAPKAGQTYYKG